MMTAEQLKNSILQLAMQGKLVEQRPEEGTGEELYWKIQAAEKKLIKEGKVKKRRLSDSVKDDIPFDIPDSWRWVRFSEISSVINGDRGKNYPSKSTLSHEGIPFISALNLDGRTVVEDDSLLCVSQDQYDRLGSGKLEKGDIVICIRGSLGKHGRYPFEKGAIASSLVICRQFIKSEAMAHFIMSFLDAPLFFDQIKQYDNGTAQPNLAAKSLEQFFMPLPPLAEQKRIVAKIEEMMPFVEQYAAVSTKLNTLNTTFPDMMKKSILQEAVQGKLVPQDPNDEPASVLLKKIAEEKKRLIKEGKIKKQKTLPEITEDEIPFDIPESWEWVRLSDISKQITDGEHSTPRRVSEYCGFYLLSARNVRDSEIKLDDVDFVDSSEFERISSRCNPVKGDVLISCSGSVGRCAVVNDDNKYVMVRSAAMASPIMCDSNYLMYSIQSDCVQRQINALKKQTAQANLFLGAISFLKIPLPPYHEQKRIVNRLKQILNHTEKAFNTLSFE